MFRQLSAIIALVCASQFAQAAEAGRVIFAAGSAQVDGKPAVDGTIVQEGDMLTTGAGGNIYVRTVDSGLFIVRANSKARIVAYHVDAAEPANTRIKLELLSGVARSRSGNAVKLARQNFRFNTPVAAIGVRGTDFTVFTDDDVSRVAVISGGVVVSGFVGACRPEGVGPCEGGTSRELSASQRGVLLQIQRGKETPQLMQGGSMGPDQVSPARSEEPIVKNGGNNGSTMVTGSPSLDPQKGNSLNQATPVASNPVQPKPPPVVVVVEEPAPPVIAPPVPPVVELPVYARDARIVWGRWQPLLDLPRKINFDVEKYQHDLVALNGYYALFRTKDEQDRPYVAPSEGKVGFSMAGSEAFVFSTADTGIVTAEKATLSNGKLLVDFGARTFATSVDLVSRVDAMNLKAEGTINSVGGMFGDAAAGRKGYMNVEGLLSNDSGGSAAYVLDARLDVRRTVNGVTYWKQ